MCWDVRWVLRKGRRQLIARVVGAHRASATVYNRRLQSQFWHMPMQTYCRSLCAAYSCWTSVIYCPFCQTLPQSILRFTHLDTRNQGCELLEKRPICLGYLRSAIAKGCGGVIPILARSLSGMAAQDILVQIAAANTTHLAHLICHRCGPSHAMQPTSCNAKQRN